MQKLTEPDGFHEKVRKHILLKNFGKILKSKGQNIILNLLDGSEFFYRAKQIEMGKKRNSA